MPDKVLSKGVKFPHGGSKLDGFIARPAGTRKRPGIIVIQEWWGLNPNIKDITTRFAQEGFVALAPDLYHGKVTTKPDEAMKLTMALNQEAAVREIASAIDYLKSDASCTGKIGIVGFCLGGELAMLTGVRKVGISACVPFYGSPPDPLEQVKHLESPLLGHFAELDHYITPKVVRSLRTRLKKQGKDARVYIYKGADHGFFNDTSPIYHKRAAGLAWRRTLDFFRTRLKG